MPWAGLEGPAFTAGLGNRNPDAGLVESLATRWGHLGDRNGRVVWFEAAWH